MRPPVLTVDDCALTYPGADAPTLHGVDLAVDAGRCVALLGPNGAGKTTLVRCITGLRRPDRGSVRVAGGDPTSAATRRHLGVMLQDGALPRHLTVRELVGGAAVRSGLPAAAATAVLAEIGLGDLAGERTGRLSGGQRRRVHLARALVTAPDLLVLDEPTVGLDADARREFWERLAARRDAGMAILLTTHLVEEAGAVADRVAVIADGRVVADTDPATLTAALPDRTVSARTSLAAGRLRALVGAAGSTQVDGDRFTVVTGEPEALLRRLLDADPDLADLRVQGASLEDAVLSVSHGAAGPGAGPATTTVPSAVATSSTSASTSTSTSTLEVTR